MLLALEMEEGATSQGMQWLPEARKDKETNAFLKLLEGTQPSEAYIGLLASETVK